jgi:hypothetical protein
MNSRILGIIGALLVLVGIFCPLVNFSILDTTHSVSYLDSFRGGGGIDGIIIAGLGVISLILAALNKTRVLIATGILTLCLLALDYFNFQSKMSELSSLNEKVAATITSGTSLQWGWVVLVLGALLLLAAGLMKKAVPPPATGYAPPLPPQGYNPGQPPPPPPYNR